MKDKTTIAFLLAALLLVGSGVHAESNFGPGHHRGFHGPRISDSLQLSEAQKADIRNLLASSRESLRPLHDRLRELRQQFRSAAESQPFDESQVRYQAQEMAKLQAELMVARAALMNQVSALLTPEQRARWNDLREQRKQHLQERWQRRRHPSQVEPG